jgi:hypothetical protein
MKGSLECEHDIKRTQGLNGLYGDLAFHKPEHVYIQTQRQHFMVSHHATLRAYKGRAKSETTSYHGESMRVQFSNVNARNVYIQYVYHDRRHLGPW